MGIFDIFSDKPAKDAAAAQIGGLNKGYDLAGQLYNTGRTDLTSNFGKASDAFTGLQRGTQAGSDAYADATGVNGPEGLARAKALFTATPGYTEGLNMTLDQNDRRAAGRGMLASGNTNVDTAKIATDYSNMKYNDYASKLAPFVGANQNAVAGGAAVNTGLGTSLNTNDVNQGQLGFNTQAGIGNANANADLAKYNVSSNIMNAFTKLLGGAANLGGSFNFSNPGSPGSSFTPTTGGSMGGKAPDSSGGFDLSKLLAFAGV